MPCEAVNIKFSKEGEFFRLLYHGFLVSAKASDLYLCAAHLGVIKATRLVGIARKQSAALIPFKDAKTTSIFSTHSLSIHTSIDWLLGELMTGWCK